MENIHIDEGLNVAIDCNNGVPGVLIKKLFKSLSINTVIINEKVDGNFPNYAPDPSKEKNLKQ